MSDYGLSLLWFILGFFQVQLDYCSCSKFWIFLPSENVFFLVLISVLQSEICLSHYFLLSIFGEFIDQLCCLQLPVKISSPSSHFQFLSVFSFYSFLISALLPFHLILCIFLKFILLYFISVILFLMTFYSNFMGASS